MMSPSTEAFARVASALVADHDLTGVLADLLADARSALSAGAIGLLVQQGTGHLELLTATSHSAAQLELFQIQERTGPCIDAVTSGSPVWESGVERLRNRWPEVGSAIEAAGYVEVHAYPLRWRERHIGAMNVFFSQLPENTGAMHVLGQAFADMATLVILHPEELAAREIVERTERALAGRTIIEQAKGVLAYQEELTTDAAYDALRARASQEGLTLTAMAHRVIDEASNAPRR